jgi:MSHA biogenesis protein MshM
LAVVVTLVVGLALGFLLNQWRAENLAKQNLRESAKPEEKITEKTVAPLVIAPVAEIKQVEPVMFQPEAQSQSNQAAPTPTLALAQTPAPAAPVSASTAATAVAPITASSDILELRLQATKNWLNQQPASTVSIQLMGNSNDDQLKMGLESEQQTLCDGAVRQLPKS